MGQQHSAEKEKSTVSRSGTPNDKVSRRKSAHPPSGTRGRGTPVQAAATTESATAQTSSPQHLEAPQLQQILQSSSPEPTSRNKIGRSPSKREKKDDPPHPRHGPVNVPSASEPMSVPTSTSSRSKPDGPDERSFEKPDFHEGQDDFERRYVPPADHRPPRLPLPIADAGPIPDSPTLEPIDKGGSDLEFFGTEEPLSAAEPHLRRKSSMMSTATQDEEDIGDELPPVDPAAETVPTTIEWNYSGHRIYVTGTFTNWERKYRMHHKKESKGFATTINLPPGTHHLMFLVDEVMTTNPGMPTAVDFNNILVNYIEIATEDLQKTRRESKQGDEKRDSIQIHPPQVLPEEDHFEPESQPDEEVEPVAEEVLPGDFRQIVPHSLIDMDLPEDDPRYHQAARVINDSQVPPGLPLFLSKSLLNGNTPVKDDSSVLTLPNHTVLNHLMTSSVKNGVLATSVTTRYKKKYVTTISFKPVPKVSQAVA